MRRVLASVAAVALIGGALAPPAWTFATTRPGASSALHTTVAIRRLTESQYRHAIADAFGADIQINGRFEPGRREEGLLAVGNRDLSITSGGFEQYYAIARSVADQALDAKRLPRTLACKPEATGCAATFVEDYGRQLFRRPLTRTEIDGRVAVATRAAAQTKDPVEGLKLALVSLLMAPDFLFRIEQAEPDPDHPGQLRLDGWTKASRLSYLLWDAGPDAELLAAAASGALHTQAGVEAQLKRMIAASRLEAGARAFFADMLQLDALEGLTKDAAAYPKFSAALVDSAREQTLRTMIRHLVAKDGDYRDIFTTNTTEIDRRLAAVYKAPFLAGGAEWTPYTFPADAERAGVLTEVSFLAAHAHPAASSPTRRGVKVHEIFKCSPTPEPPADVDFSKVQATDKGTVRSRLLDHMTNPGCSSCHSRSDPVGLTLEHFDGLGQKRTLENGAPIDVSAQISGKTLTGAPGLGQSLHDDPRVPACLVKQVYAYGVGREPDGAEEAWLKTQTAAFVSDGYRLRSLMTRIAGAPEFFKVVAPEKSTPKPPPAGRKVADARTSQPIRGGAR